jgi:hypothetical protein
MHILEHMRVTRVSTSAAAAADANGAAFMRGSLIINQYGDHAI